MGKLLISLINMSITASYLALAVMLLRLVLKKAPRWIFVALWAMVGIRLVLPITLESSLSAVPNPEPVPQTILLDPVPQVNTGIPFVNSVVNPMLESTMTPAVGDSANPMQVVIEAAQVVWLVGMGLMTLYTLASYLRLRRKVREAVVMEGRVQLCDHIPSPFILGLFQPKIYLPSSIDPSDIPYVVAHEKAHLKRLDHIWKPLGFLLLTIYWFNPILWVSYILLCRDIETACDEKVLRQDGEQNKKAYSQALLNCSVSRRSIAACPLAFGETGVKGRIQNILNYKRPAFWIILIALIAGVVVGVCLLTNPVGTDIPDQLEFQMIQWIKEKHNGSHTDEHYVTVNYEIIGKETSQEGITVYMWVLYEEYSFDGELTLETGSHMLTAITAQKQEGINYRLVEYWNPQDGRGYTDSVKEKLPWYLHRKGLDSQRTADSLSKLSRSKAEAYYANSSIPNSNMPMPEISTPLFTTIPLTPLPQNQDFWELDASEGLTVCVWQMAEHNYNCLLLPDKNAIFDTLQLVNKPFVNLEQMAAILESYNIPDEQIRVVVIQMPHSSYIGRSDDAFVDKIREKLGLEKNIQLKLPYYTSQTIDFSADIASTTWTNAYSEAPAVIFSAHQVVTLPVWHCESPEELAQLQSALGNNMDLTLSQYGLPSFEKLAQSYGEDFFRNKSLMVVYTAAPHSGYQFLVNNVTWYSNGEMKAALYWNGQSGGDTVYAGRLICIAVDKKYSDSCRKFSANMSYHPLVPIN